MIKVVRKRCQSQRAQLAVAVVLSETPDHFRGWHFGKGTVRGAAGSNSI